jgi:Porin subfamily
MNERARSMVLAIATAAAMLAPVTAPAFVQTLAPTLVAPAAQSKMPQPKTSQSPPKPAPAGRANPCGIYGKGFTNVPGTDSCVKVDGSIQTDVGVSVRR